MQYIALLRKCGLRAKLREARLGMQALFPLSPPLWLDWLADEAAAGATPEFLDRLHADAVEDYLSVDVWLARLAHARQRTSLAEPSAVAGLRELFEEALAAGGLHVREGGRLWDAYRRFVWGDWSERMHRRLHAGAGVHRGRRERRRPAPTNPQGTPRATFPPSPPTPPSPSPPTPSPPLPPTPPWSRGVQV